MLGSLLAPLLQSAPDVPEAPQVDAQASQRTAIQGNLDTAPMVQNYADLWNTFNQGQWDKSLENSLPGFKEWGAGLVKQYAALARGEIPSDISDLTQNSDAARAIGGGYAGSGMHRNLVARDLGLTSLSVMQTGLNSLNQWLKMTQAPVQDYSRMFAITPEMQIQNDWNNAESTFQHDYTQDLYNSQYDMGNMYGQALLNIEAQGVQLTTAAIGAVGGAAGGAMCWVAREVYGESSPKWLQFRAWMLEDAAPEFRAWYLRNGERFAAFLKQFPMFKPVVQQFMDEKLKEKHEHF